MLYYDVRYWYRNPEDERIALYRQLAEITRERCGACSRPFSCCDPMYCQSAIQHAREEWGQELVTTQHPHLPLMGPTGCTVDPHLRPICSTYVCQEHLERDPEFAEEYWDLRARIDELEGRSFGKKRHRRPRDARRMRRRNPGPTESQREEVLITLVTELYDGSWEELESDLRAAAESFSYRRKLMRLIERDLRLINKLKMED